MNPIFQFMVDISAPFIAGTVALCVIDWIVVMFKRLFS